MATYEASCTTLSYKRLPNDEEVLLDFYPPETSGSALPIKTIPAILYFHSGGLLVGNRRAFFFPAWLQKRANSLGYAFISADHQLLLPGTGHDILKDIQDVFKFIIENNFTHKKTTFEIDAETIVLAGGSSGGGLAYLAAAHISSPKPKGVLALYAMGGDFFAPHSLQPKTKPFFMGQPLLDPANFSKFLHPFPEGLPAPTSDVPPAVDPATSLPTEPRMSLVILSLQLGNWLDYYTGEFNPSLSGILRDALDANVPPLSLTNLVPERHRSLFPTFMVNSSWPPTLMLHGTADTVVRIHSSRRMKSLLTNAGVSAELIELEGQEHVFDTQPNSDVEFADVYDKVEEFLKRCMQA